MLLNLNFTIPVLVGVAITAFFAFVVGATSELVMTMLGLAVCAALSNTCRVRGRDRHDEIHHAPNRLSADLKSDLLVIGVQGHSA